MSPPEGLDPADEASAPSPANPEEPLETSAEDAPPDEPEGSLSEDEGWFPDPDASSTPGELDSDEGSRPAQAKPVVPLRPAIRGQLAAHLKQVGAVTARLGLAEAERAHDHLASTALWLALANLDVELGPSIERWLAGSAWDHVFPDAPQTPALQRLALGLSLLDAARRPGTPASARALAGLAAVALGCANPPTGRRLQPACAELGFLPLTEQVPVALPIRQLILEFRHLDLRQSPAPAFVARVEDLPDRLDRTELLGVRLTDHPAAILDPSSAWWTALVGSRSPSLALLARLVLTNPSRTEEDLLEALALHDLSWEEEGASIRLAALRATLAERLADTPLAGRVRSDDS
ncbi:MAG: hypothetical protein JKY65_08395 [Planctomycetes bacterium]|nr:hypothetical protein [Planctomycetota bacterium]